MDEKVLRDLPKPCLKMRTAFRGIPMHRRCTAMKTRNEDAACFPILSKSDVRLQMTATTSMSRLPSFKVVPPISTSSFIPPPLDLRYAFKCVVWAGCIQSDRLDISGDERGSKRCQVEAAELERAGMSEVNE